MGARKLEEGCSEVGSWEDGTPKDCHLKCGNFKEGDLEEEVRSRKLLEVRSLAPTCNDKKYPLLMSPIAMPKSSSASAAVAFFILLRSRVASSFELATSGREL